MGFRDKNTSNLDKGLLMANEDFETCERRNVIGLIYIHVGDLLISRSVMFTDYITQRMAGNPKWIDTKKMRRPNWGWGYLKWVAEISTGSFRIRVNTKTW